MQNDFLNERKLRGILKSLLKNHTDMFSFAFVTVQNFKEELNNILYQSLNYDEWPVPHLLYLLAGYNFLKEKPYFINLLHPIFWINIPIFFALIAKAIEKEALSIPDLRGDMPKTFCKYTLKINSHAYMQK